MNLEAGALRVVEGKGLKDRELPIIPRLERILRSSAHVLQVLGPHVQGADNPATLGTVVRGLTRPPRWDTLFLLAAAFSY